MCFCITKHHELVNKSETLVSIEHSERVSTVSFYAVLV
jgi:hypothetical protein